MCPYEWIFFLNLFPLSPVKVLSTREYRSFSGHVCRDKWKAEIKYATGTLMSTSTKGPRFASSTRATHSSRHLLPLCALTKKKALAANCFIELLWVGWQKRFGVLFNATDWRRYVIELSDRIYRANFFTNASRRDTTCDVMSPLQVKPL